MRFTTEKYTLESSHLLLSIKQRYKLNAIHNKLGLLNKFEKTIVNKAKIQIECDSQLVSDFLKVSIYYCQ